MRKSNDKQGNRQTDIQTKEQTDRKIEKYNKTTFLLYEKNIFDVKTVKVKNASKSDKDNL